MSNWKPNGNRKYAKIIFVFFVVPTNVCICVVDKNWQWANWLEELVKNLFRLMRISFFIRNGERRAPNLLLGVVENYRKAEPFGKQWYINWIGYFQLLSIFCSTERKMEFDIPSNVHLCHFLFLFLNVFFNVSPFAFIAHAMMWDCG